MCLLCVGIHVRIYLGYACTFCIEQATNYRCTRTVAEGSRQRISATNFTVAVREMCARVYAASVLLLHALQRK